MYMVYHMLTHTNMNLHIYTNVQWTLEHNTTKNPSATTRRPNDDLHLNVIIIHITLFIKSYKYKYRRTKLN